MKTDFDLVPLDRDHSNQLLALSRACPIEADFTFWFDRSPDYFAWPKAVFDSHHYFGPLSPRPAREPQG